MAASWTRDPRDIPLAFPQVKEPGDDSKSCYHIPPIQAVHCVSCRFDLFPHHGRVCQGNKFLTAWATTWVSSSESSSLRLCFWLSNGRTATLPTTKVMSLLKCQGGRCHGVKGQGSELHRNARPWQRMPMLSDCTSLLLCFTDCRS